MAARDAASQRIVRDYRDNERERVDVMNSLRLWHEWNEEPIRAHSHDAGGGGMRPHSVRRAWSSTKAMHKMTAD